MKPGDIVKFTERYEKQNGRTFLVLERYPKSQNPFTREPDHSRFAQWAIVDMTNGSVYTQIGRDLEVINENR